VTTTLNYATVHLLLLRDPAPCPLGVGTYGADQQDYDNIRNNTEAILLLQRQPDTPGEVSSETETETVEEGFPGLTEDTSPVGETQAEAQQDTSLTDAGEEVFGVEPEADVEAQPEALEAEADDEPSAEEEPELEVKDDFVIEAIAASEDRLNELVDWVNDQLGSLMFDRETLEAYISWRQPEEIEGDKWVTSTLP